MQTMAAILFSVLVVIGTATVAMPAHAAPPDAHCTCRARDGSKHEVGETVCIRVGDAPYLARCEKELNVTTWRRLQDGCPTASLSLRQTSFRN